MTEQFLFHVQLLEELDVSEQITLNYICYLAVSRSTILERGLISDSNSLLSLAILERLNKLDNSVEWTLYHKLDMAVHLIESCVATGTERNMIPLINIVKQLNKMNQTIGIYYELPDGKIVYTYRYMRNGIKNTISYYFDDNEGSKTVDQDEFDTWKPRKDLKDFPNAKDPRLPYVFDLYWDIKYTSQLKQKLRLGHPDEKEIREKMKELNISE